MPSLTRDQREEAIRGPIERAGGSIADDLVERLLNDSAEEQDQLPVLQHTLMRTWQLAGNSNSRNLTLPFYLAAGGTGSAISRHADELLDELHGLKPVVEQVFRALAELDRQGRGIRRPLPFAQLAAETGMQEGDVRTVVDRFRRDDCSFLVPLLTARRPLAASEVVDVGHEALIRGWKRLLDLDKPDDRGIPTGWLRDEERDGEVYRMLLQFSVDAENAGGTPLPPSLTERHILWWKKRRRTAAWTKRYGGKPRMVEELLERSNRAVQQGRFEAVEDLYGTATLPRTAARNISTTRREELGNQAHDLTRRLAGLSTPEDLAQAKALVEELRNVREYGQMGRLAEAVSRLDPKDARNRRLYAQYLIETGMATAAADVLQNLARRLPKTDPEHAEATGLLGCVYKQVFFDAGDKTSPGARSALKQAIAMYREPFERDPAQNTWHGVNLLALLSRAKRLGLPVAPDLAPREVAQAVIAGLHAVPPERRDEWYLPTLADASLGLGDWTSAEKCIRGYAAAEDAKAFLVASTLRQLTQVWDLEAVDARGRALVDILRARLAELPGGKVDLAPADLQRLRAQPPVDKGQLEAVLGRQGPETYRWWKAGLDRAASVAAVYERMGDRVGTAFLVRAGDLGRTPADELLVLTNFHVVNQDGVSPGIRPEAAEIVFEAQDAERRCQIDRILWSSPPERHDASLLRLKEPVVGIEPLALATSLPVLDETARVYIIGHPRGGALAFSFQDNELLDHEGPPDGRPQIEGVCRLHYRTPTMGGSSGSPVFDARQWEVVALHHKGGTMGMPRLNGKEGTYGANEGLALLAIIEDIASAG